MRPATGAVAYGAEEGFDGGEVGGAGGAEGGKQLVEEGGRAVEEERLGAEVEVAIFGFGLGVALRAVEREVVAVKGALAGGVHVAEQSAVEGVVIAGKEIIVASEGGVSFEFLGASVSMMATGIAAWKEESWKRRTLWPSNPSSSPSRSPVAEVREVASQPMDSFSVITSPSKATPRVASNTARS